MNTQQLDRIGDWNPQLYRELKGKLKPRNLIVAVLSSLLLQGLVLLFNFSHSSHRVPELMANRETGGIAGVICLFFVAPLLILLMAALLSPSRQTLLDWARYRHWQKAEKRGLLRDLLLGEKSPSTGAIAFQCVLIGLLWLPWIVLFYNSPTFREPSSNAGDVSVGRFSIALILTAIVYLIYVTLYQSIRFKAKNFNRAIVRALPWGSVLLIPNILLAVFQLAPQQAPLLWLFTPAPFASAFYVSAIKLLFAFASQFALLAFLTHQLQQQLKRVGESEFKRKFEGENSRSVDP